MSLLLVGKFITRVFPAVDAELGRWRVRAAGENRELVKQARASIRDKRFHAQGGSIYALAEGNFNRDLVRLIVALQTISDYLDNLCDRAGCLDRGAFRRLHESMPAAVDPARGLADFYDQYPYRGDGGYLEALVRECRDVVRTLPAYDTVRPDITRLVGLYSDLQVYKHTHVADREPLLTGWFESHRCRHPDLYWWEFAAATGSTLGMFALFAAASRSELTAAEAAQISAAYFPWVAGLHILLDYFIDQEEDRRGGDLNFIRYYRDRRQCEDRLLVFARRALESVSGLPRPHFHRTVVKGLLALYLSDPKVRRQNLDRAARELIHACGRDTVALFRLCGLLRRARVV